MSARVLSIYFENLLLRSPGEQFQRIFNELMSRAHRDYVAVQPWGAHGDRGNDGYIPNEWRFFQLYAPSGSESSPVASSKKALADFQKLLAAYAQLRHYHFVLNDRFQGIPAPVAEALGAIKVRNGQMGDVSPIGSHQLRSKFEELDENARVLIVGDLPSTVPKELDLTVLGSLLKDLADADPDDIALSRIELPAEFEVKADFNRFDQKTKEQLKHYARRSHLVEKLLQSRGPQWLQAVSEEVGVRYRSLSHVRDPNEKILRLVELLVPSSAANHPHSLKAYRESALLVIAKYFEACDVFENPNSTYSAKAR